MQSTACTQMRGAHLIDGAGHGFEQEQPEQVSGLIVHVAKNSTDCATALERPAR
jgi:hypothetical protein